MIIDIKILIQANLTYISAYKKSTKLTLYVTITYGSCWGSNSAKARHYLCFPWHFPSCPGRPTPACSSQPSLSSLPAEICKLLPLSPLFSSFGRTEREIPNHLRRDSRTRPSSSSSCPQSPVTARDISWKWWHPGRWGRPCPRTVQVKGGGARFSYSLIND